MPTTTARIGLTTALVALLCGAVAPAARAQTWALYDDFSAATFSPTKWATEDVVTDGAILLEMRRALVNAQARLEARGYGDIVRNTGSSTARSTLLLRSRTRSITAMKATITMRGGSASRCAANPSIGSHRARLQGAFFNIGSPRAGTRLNDVAAGISVYRLAVDDSVYRVSAYANVCTNEDCSESIQLGTSDLPIAVLVNVPVTVSVAWDAAGNAFRYTANGVTSSIPYTVADAEPASVPHKRMEVVNVMPQCTSARAMSIAGADFDDVYINSIPKLVSSPEGDLSAEDGSTN